MRSILSWRVVRMMALAVAGLGCLAADDLKWGGTYAQTWSGFGTSPYTANDSARGVLTIFCLDFNDEIAPPMEWQATIRPLTSTNVQDYAQFGGSYGQGITAVPFAFTGDTPSSGAHSVDLSMSSDPYTRYLEAAWLFSNIKSALVPPGDTASEIISQVAAWDLFVDSSHKNTLAADIQNTGGTYTFKNYLSSSDGYASPPTIASISPLSFEEAVDEALKAAQDAVVTQHWATSSYFDDWRIVTGDPSFVTVYGRPVQEFLTTSVPEPSAIVLLTTVIAVLGFARRRKNV